MLSPAQYEQAMITTSAQLRTKTTNPECRPKRGKSIMRHTSPTRVPNSGASCGRQQHMLRMALFVSRANRDRRPNVGRARGAPLVNRESPPKPDTRTTTSAKPGRVTGRLTGFTPWGRPLGPGAWRRNHPRRRAVCGAQGTCSLGTQRRLRQLAEA
jgi:hypothetical protein